MSVDPIINETQLNIILDTNIQGEQPFSLTKSVLYNQLLKDMNGFSDNPYFSSTIPYPESILRNLDYVNQVAFFFKKDDFLRILKETTEYKTLFEKIDKKEKEKKELLKRKISGEKGIVIDASFLEINIDEDEKNKNIKKNIMLMLILIFPTNYPTYNNITNSYDSIFGGIMSTASSFSGILPFLLSITLGMKSTKQKYSYIKSPSKGICTVTQVIWLNDLYNHPEYKKIVAEYMKFQEWKIIETEKKEKELDEELKKFKDNYLTGLKKLDQALNLIKPKDRFKQTYYGINDKDYLQEYNEIKLLLSEISGINIFQSENINLLVKFKRSFNILKERIGKELQDTRKDFNPDKIIRGIDDLDMKNEIITTYLSKKELEIEKEKEKDMYQSTLTTDEKDAENLKNRIKREWKDYNKYSDFIKLIQSFTRPTSESTNKNLQESIEKFIKGSDSDFEKLLAQALENSPSIETGITVKQNNPVKNTIYLRMDIIAGEINDENKSSINCIFNGEYLGNELKRLIKPGNKSFELNQYRFFFDLNSKKGIEVNKNDPVKNDPVKQGGKKTRKKRSKK